MPALEPPPRMESAEAPNPSRPRGKRIALGAAFIIALGLFFAFDGPRYLNLATLKAHRDTLAAFAEQHFLAAVLLGFTIYVSAVTLSLPGVVVLSLTAGFVFGRWVGSAIVLAAGTLGATIVFLGARYLFADWARRRLGNLGEKINARFMENAFYYLLFLRFVPVLPFFAVNLAPALTTIPTRTYILATMIGIVPGTLVFVNLGEALGRIDSVWGLLSVRTLTAFLLLAPLALVPVWFRRRAMRKDAGT